MAKFKCVNGHITSTAETGEFDSLCPDASTGDACDCLAPEIGEYIVSRHCEEPIFEILSLKAKSLERPKSLR